MIVERDAILALGETLYAMEALWAPPMPDWANERYYAREPLPVGDFLHGMNTIGPPAGRSFLDAGCGAGSKIHLARSLGWDYISGFDRHQPYVFAARELCPWANIWTAEAIQCHTYHEYDVVYCYRLCVDDEEQRNMERVIASRMKPGSLAFFPQALTVPGKPLGYGVFRMVGTVDA